MTFATGGSACAATSPRSRFLAYAYSRASSVVLIPSWPPSSSMRRSFGTRMASLMRVVSRLDGRTCSTGLRLGLKGRSPSWAYSSSYSIAQKSRCMQRPASSSQNSKIALPTRLNPARAPHHRWAKGGEERVRPCFSGVKRSKPGRECLEALLKLASSTFSDGQAVLAFPVAVDDHEGDFLELGRPDPLPDRLG